MRKDALRPSLVGSDSVEDVADEHARDGLWGDIIISRELFEAVAVFMKRMLKRECVLVDGDGKG